MKRSLHLLDTLRFGGGESVALNYARLMRDWDVDSTLAGRKDSSGFQRFASEYATLSNRFSLRLLRESDYIFIHTNRKLFKTFLLRLFFRRRNQQIIYIQHLRYSERKFRWLSGMINVLCTGFIRITPLTAGLTDKYLKIPVSFIPNFYIRRYTPQEEKAIRREWRLERGIGCDKILILFTGALRVGKGLTDFLELAGRFASDDRYLFIIAGDGEESQRICDYPHRNLYWTGWQTDIESCLIASDIYCFFSRNEMMPMALTEAVAVGIPVAAFSSPVNDFVLGGDTFGGIDAVEAAIRRELVVSVRPVYAEKNASRDLKKILRVEVPRKLLHIQVLPKLTGVQRISLEILRHLPEKEYEKTILFGAPDTPQTEACLQAFREDGIRIIREPSLRREIGWHDWRAFLRIYRLCRSEKFDIVHTHSTKPGVVGRLAARLAGTPRVIHTVHGVSFHRYAALPLRVFYYASELFVSLFSHKIITVADYYRKYYAFFKGKLTVIPNGIRIADLPDLPDETTQSEEGLIRLLFVGRLAPPKDPMTLLRAMERIVNRFGRENIRLTMVGDGELEQDCRRFIHDHGLSDYVILPGWKMNTAPYYTDHQIFCLSSIHEAFGLSLAEAGFYGLPAVATRVGGVPEVVLKGETGLLVPPRDPEALAQAILSLADDPDRRKKMGESARRRITEKFTAEKMAAEYKRIYNEKR